MALNLQGKVSLDGSGFEAGIEKMSHKLKEFALEAFGIYTVSEAIKKTVEYADDLVDTANRLGIGTKALQEFGFAARMTGAEMEKLTGFVEKLNTSRIDPKKFGAFAKLGISEGDLANLSVEDLMMKISGNVRGRSSQEIVGPLREIGGKGAGALIPMLKDDLDDLREKAHAFGQVMEMEDLVQLKHLADEVKILSQMILIGLGPAIVFLMERFVEAGNEIRAAVAFYRKLFGSGVTGSDLKAAAAPIAEFRLPMKSEVDVWRKIKAAISDAGKESDYELNNQDEHFEEMQKKLLAAQKELEGINAKPDFESVIEKKKADKFNPLHPEIAQGDSLLRIGNFLGSGQSVIETIGHRHTHLLTQIERNTRAKNSQISGQVLDETFAV
jgi:hypothetical protein